MTDREDKRSKLGVGIRRRLLGVVVMVVCAKKEDEKVEVKLEAVVWRAKMFSPPFSRSNFIIFACIYNVEDEDPCFLRIMIQEKHLGGSRNECDWTEKVRSTTTTVFQRWIGAYGLKSKRVFGLWARRWSPATAPFLRIDGQTRIQTRTSLKNWLRRKIHTHTIFTVSEP